MKNLFTIAFLLLALFFSNNTYAKIWRVNNTPAVVADFTTPQAAHDAASAGDTIHIEASASGYGGINVTKRIVLIGDGAFLTTDTLLQANTNVSQVSTIDFQSGSANSVMEGLYATVIYFETDHILVKRNYMSATYVYLYAGANNCTFSGNYFSSYAFIEQSGPVSNLTISNNIFTLANFSFGTDVSGVFENNTVYYGYGISLYNFQVDNNIFSSCAFTANNIVPFNNIGSGTQFGTANGNQQNVDMSTVFVNYSNADAGLQLKAGSAAIGAGYGGVDCGAYGGPNPYKIGLQPNVPAIYKLSVPAVGTTNINVTVSTKSNN